MRRYRCGSELRILCSASVSSRVVGRFIDSFLWLLVILHSRRVSAAVRRDVAHNTLIEKIAHSAVVVSTEPTVIHHLSALPDRLCPLALAFGTIRIRISEL